MLYQVSTMYLGINRTLWTFSLRHISKYLGSDRPNHFGCSCHIILGMLYIL